MESLTARVQRFVSPDIHEVFELGPDSGGDGYGSAECTGLGYGPAEGFGTDLSGFGCGLDISSGSGSADCEGYGFGLAPGEGEAWGGTADYGDCCSAGEGIKSINGWPVYMINGTMTIITDVSGNLAKGFIVKHDMSQTPCYIFRKNGVFAHGRTVRKAYRLLKQISEDYGG